MSTTAEAPPTTTALVPTTAPALPEAVSRRGIDEPQWRTLINNLYPGAKTDSVLMVVDYCKARCLDPLKKPCHIVPMEVKDARTNTKEWRDVVMPGIYEYRITAHRTGLYLGHSKPEYGPLVKTHGVEAPAWCEMTMYRWNTDLRMRCEFPVMVHFSEVVATNREGNANQRWSKASIQMLTKCCEAAGLREAFPEEFGGEQTAEEMDGQRNTIDVTPPVPMPQRASERATTGGDAPTDRPVGASGNGGVTTGAAAASPQFDRITALKRFPQQSDANKSWWTVAMTSGVSAFTKDQAIGGLLETIGDKGVRLHTDGAAFAKILAVDVP